jgi:hypothetical protein
VQEPEEVMRYYQEARIQGPEEKNVLYIIFYNIFHIGLLAVGGQNEPGK